MYSNQNHYIYKLIRHLSKLTKSNYEKNRFIISIIITDPSKFM